VGLPWCVQLVAQSGDELGIAQVWDRELGWPLNEVLLQMEDSMGFSGLDFDGDSGEVVGGTICKERGYLCRSFLFDFFEIEAAGAIAEGGITVAAAWWNYETLLEEVEVSVPVSAIVGSQPRGELLAGGRWRWRVLGGAGQSQREDRGNGLG
jgi:hypothetical protein